MCHGKLFRKQLGSHGPKSIESLVHVSPSASMHVTHVDQFKSQLSSELLKHSIGLLPSLQGWLPWEYWIRAWLPMWSHWSAANEVSSKIATFTIISPRHGSMYGTNHERKVIRVAEWPCRVRFFFCLNDHDCLVRQTKQKQTLNPTCFMWVLVSTCQFPMETGERTHRQEPTAGFPDQVR